MLRLIKYLKPYTLLILLTIVLLFVQANADLALPDYMSKIVNVGIQQGGVENAVPEAVRQSQMEKLLIFMSPSDQALVLNNYTLVDKNSPEYDQYSETYPALANEPVFVLKEVADQAVINQMNPIMGRAWVVISGIEQMINDPSKANSLMPGFDFDLTQLPPGMDVYALLRQLPDEQLSRMTATVDQVFEALGDSKINQMAVSAVDSEYEALGMDAAKLQSNYILRTGGVMLLISLLGGICTVAVGYLASKTAAGTARLNRAAACCQLF